jgi:hypothetical protein
VASQVLMWWLIMMDDPIRAARPRFTKMLQTVFSHPITLKTFKVGSLCIRLCASVCMCEFVGEWEAGCVGRRGEKVGNSVHDVYVVV